MNREQEPLHPRHLAECLWLGKVLSGLREDAVRPDVPEEQEPRDPEQDPVDSKDDDSRPGDPSLGPEDSPQSRTPEEQTEPEPERTPAEEIGIEEGGSDPQEVASGVPTSAQSQSMPSLAPLENPLAYSRALHRMIPLKEVPGVQEIDIEKTVKFSAAAGKGIHPVLVEKRERKGHLVILEATGLTQSPWKSTVDRLVTIARGVGAYRDVQRVPLQLNSQGTSEETETRLESSLRLALRPGRPTVVLLVHDGVDDTVENGELGAFLEQQIRRVDTQARLAWLHPWPQQRWDATAVEGLFRRGLGSEIDGELVLPVLPLGLGRDGRPGITQLERWLEGINPQQIPSYGLPIRSEDFTQPGDTLRPVSEEEDPDWLDRFIDFSQATSETGVRLLGAAMVATAVADISVPFMEVLCSVDPNGKTPDPEEARFAVASAISSGFFEVDPNSDREKTDLIRLNFKAGSREAIREFIAASTISEVINRLRSGEFRQKVQEYLSSPHRNLADEINWNLLSRLVGDEEAGQENLNGPRIDTDQFSWVARAMGHDEKTVESWIEAEPASFSTEPDSPVFDPKSEEGESAEPAEDRNDLSPIGVDDPTLSKYLKGRGEVADILRDAETYLVLISHVIEQEDPFATLQELYEKDPYGYLGDSASDFGLDANLLSKIEGWPHPWSPLILGPHRKDFIEIYRLYASLIANEWVWILSALKNSETIREHYLYLQDKSDSAFKALLELMSEFQRFVVGEASFEDVLDSVVHADGIGIKSVVSRFKVDRKKLPTSPESEVIPPHLEVGLANDVLEKTSIHNKDRIYWTKDSANRFLNMLLDFLPVDELVRELSKVKATPYPDLDVIGERGIPSAVHIAIKDPSSLSYLRLLAVAVKDIFVDLLEINGGSTGDRHFLSVFPQVGIPAEEVLLYGKDDERQKIEVLEEILRELGDFELWPDVTLISFLYSEEFSHFTTNPTSSLIFRSPLFELYQRIRVTFNLEQAANFYAPRSMIGFIEGTNHLIWQSNESAIMAAEYKGSFKRTPASDSGRTWYTELKNNSVDVVGSYEKAYQNFINKHNSKDPRIHLTIGFAWRFANAPAMLHPEINIKNYPSGMRSRIHDIMEPIWVEKFEHGMGYAPHLLRNLAEEVIPGSLHRYFYTLPNWVTEKIEQSPYEPENDIAIDDLIGAFDFQFNESEEGFWEPMEFAIRVPDRSKSNNTKKELLRFMPSEIGRKSMPPVGEIGAGSIRWAILEEMFQDLVLVCEFLRFAQSKDAGSFEGMKLALKALKQLCEAECLSTLKAIYLLRADFEIAINNLKSISQDKIIDLFQDDLLGYFHADNFNLLENLNNFNDRNGSSQAAIAGLIGTGFECRWARFSVEAQEYARKGYGDYFQSNLVSWDPYSFDEKNVDHEQLGELKTNSLLHWNLSSGDPGDLEYADFLIRSFSRDREYPTGRLLSHRETLKVYFENGFPDHEAWLEDDFWRTVYLDCLLLDRCPELIRAMVQPPSLNNELVRELKVEFGSSELEWLTLRYEYPNDKHKGRIELHWSPDLEKFESDILHSGWNQSPELSYCSLDFEMDPFVSNEFYVYQLIDAYERVRDAFIENIADFEGQEYFQNLKIAKGELWSFIDVYRERFEDSGYPDWESAEAVVYLVTVCLWAAPEIFEDLIQSRNIEDFCRLYMKYKSKAGAVEIPARSREFLSQFEDRFMDNFMFDESSHSLSELFKNVSSEEFFTDLRQVDWSAFTELRFDEDNPNMWNCIDLLREIVDSVLEEKSGSIVQNRMRISAKDRNRVAPDSRVSNVMAGFCVPGNVQKVFVFGAYFDPFMGKFDLAEGLYWPNSYESASLAALYKCLCDNRNLEVVWPDSEAWDLGENPKDNDVSILIPDSFSRLDQFDEENIDGIARLHGLRIPNEWHSDKADYDQKEDLEFHYDLMRLLESLKSDSGTGLLYVNRKYLSEYPIRWLADNKYLQGIIELVAEGEEIGELILVLKTMDSGSQVESIVLQQIRGDYSDNLEAVLGHFHTLTANPSLGNTGIHELENDQTIKSRGCCVSVRFFKENLKVSTLEGRSLSEIFDIFEKTQADKTLVGKTEGVSVSSDLPSVELYHLRIAKFSRDMWAPQAAGAARGTKWFYEYESGQYTNEISARSLAGRRKFKTVFPRNQKFFKTDLATYMVLFGFLDGPRPDVVSLGSTKCSRVFEKELESFWENSEHLFNERHFKDLIAQAIVIKACDVIVSEADWFGGGYKSNIVAYTIAKLIHEIGLRERHLDLESIWSIQGITPALNKTLEDISRQFGDLYTGFLVKSANGRNLAEWSKKVECWNLWSDFELREGTISDALMKELLTDRQEIERLKGSGSLLVESDKESKREELLEKISQCKDEMALLEEELSTLDEEYAAAEMSFEAAEHEFSVDDDQRSNHDGDDDEAGEFIKSAHKEEIEALLNELDNKKIAIEEEMEEVEALLSELLEQLDSLEVLEAETPKEDVAQRFWSEFFRRGVPLFPELAGKKPTGRKMRKIGPSIGNRIQIDVNWTPNLISLRPLSSKPENLRPLLEDRASFEREVGIPEFWNDGSSNFLGITLLPAPKSEQKSWSVDQQVTAALELYGRIRKYLQDRM